MARAVESDAGALIPPAEAARLLTISLKTLREHVANGTLVPIHTGAGTKRRHYAFEPSDIEAFKQQRRLAGAIPCPSTKGRARKPTASILPSMVFDLQEIRKQHADKKLKK